MNDCYSFDSIGEYSVVVEVIGDGYEVSVYKHAYQNPNAFKLFQYAEEARDWGIDIAEELTRYDEEKKNA